MPLCESLETRRVLSPLPYPAGTGNLQARLVGTADFDATGSPDLLWQNHNNGDIYVELHTAPNTFEKRTLGTVPDGDRWHLVGIADMNGDSSTPDLVWFDTLTRRPAVWRIEGLQFKEFRYVSSAPIADGWRFQATGNFDGDHDSADYLWRNYITGELCVWSMSLGAAYGGFYIFDGPRDLSWSVEAARDVNSDGAPDLLWRNYATGKNAIWTMIWRPTAAGVTGFTMLPALRTMPQSWDIEAWGEFNNDNLDDIIWRNYTSGEVKGWSMNGTNKLGEFDLFTRAH
jgi:hypothetical protein